MRTTILVLVFADMTSFSRTHDDTYSSLFWPLREVNTKPEDELVVPSLPVLSSCICADKPINDTGVTVFEVKEPISAYVSVFLSLTLSFSVFWPFVQTCFLEY